MILYLDTSSLVKLYVMEPSEPEAGRDRGWESEEVRRLFAQANSVFTSVIAYPEARSGLARRRRERYFANTEAYDGATRDLNGDWQRRILKVGVSEALVREAGDLVERHGLKPYDAVHLASALTLKRRLRTEVPFSAWDGDLCRAASAEGLALAHQEVVP